MRQYPRSVYRGKEDKIRVYNEAEEVDAASRGYESAWRPESIAYKKGTEREILRVLPTIIDDGAEKVVIEEKPVFEIEEGKFEPIDTIEKLEETIPELPEDNEKVPTMAELYTHDTGKKALCDRGPYKGQETRDFIKWKKANGNV